MRTRAGVDSRHNEAQWAQEQDRAGTDDRRPAFLEVGVVEREPGLAYLGGRVRYGMKVDDLRRGCHDELGRQQRPVLAWAPATPVPRDDRRRIGPRDDQKHVPRDARGNANGNGPRSHALVNVHPAPSDCHPVRVPRKESQNRTATGTPQVPVAGWPPRNLLVPTQHEEELMNPTLTELDREWRELCRSTASHAALKRWTTTEPALTGLLTLEAVLVERKDDVEAAPAILASPG